MKYIIWLRSKLDDRVLRSDIPSKQSALVMAGVAKNYYELFDSSSYRIDVYEYENKLIKSFDI